MAKHTRKGKNPGPVDSWLDSLGYYRKNVAYDETCLFRAVSEQMFLSQIYHERVRKECIDYGKKNYRKFRRLVDNDNKWFDHLHKLDIHMVICGNIEMHIISHMYKRDVTVFDSMNRKVYNLTEYNYPDALLICAMGEDHYDVVYKREHIQTAGFCQSIVYNILYETVFEIEGVSMIVQTMLYDKPSVIMGHNEFFSDEHLGRSDESQKALCRDLENIRTATEPADSVGEASGGPLNDYEQMLQNNIAPFPFKVAKALDPTIYRNIEYDTWTETRKEMRLGDWYYGDDKLILGTCCQLNTENGNLQCYIQDILKNENKCVVYITTLAEKRTVKYTDLSPENDAKPWPLPYRFSKNVVIVPPKLQLPDRDKRNSRRRRDKNRSVSSGESANSLPPSGAGADGAESKVNVYEGCPLQMQHSPDYEQNVGSQSVAATSAPVTYQDGTLPVESSWAEQDPNNNEPIAWPPPPTPPQNPYYGQRPVIITSDDIPYTENQMYYNNMNRYHVWTNAPDYVQPEPAVPQSPHMQEIPSSPMSYAYAYYPETMYTSPPPIAADRPLCVTPMTPTSPQIELYNPPMYTQPPPPLTPVIFTPDSEVVLQSPHMPMYEIPYMPPNPFIYPPTPPAAWYPPAINAQGFMFPTPVTSPNVPARM